MLSVDQDFNSVRVWTATGIDAVGNGLTTGTFGTTPGTAAPPIYTIVAILSGGYWPYRFQHTEDTLSFRRDWGYDLTGKLNYKTADMKYDGNRDFQRYGGIMGQLNHAATLLSTGKFAFSTGKEYETYHPSYKGDLIPRYAGTLPEHNPAFSLGADITWGHITIPGCHINNNWTCYQLVCYNDYPSHGFEPLPSNPGWEGWRQDISVRLEYIKTHPTYLTGVAYMWGLVYTLFYTDIDYSVEEDVLRVSFTANWSFGSWFYSYDCEIRLNRQISYPPATTLATPGTHAITMTSSITATLNWELVSRHNIDQPGFNSPNVGDTGSSTWTCYSAPIYLASCERGSQPLYPSVPLIRSSGIRGDYARNVMKYIGDIRCSSFLSTCDAYQGINAGIDANLVEAFAEVDELVTLLPTIRKCIQDVVELASRQRQTGIRALKDVLDFATGAILFASFAVRPTLQLLIDTLPKFLAALSKLTNMPPTIKTSLYGSFSYDFPEWEFDRQHSHLLTRTKLIIESNARDVLVNLLGIRSLGIMPTPGFVWDTLPFSFVLDWFTRVGDRIRALETAAFILPVSLVSLTHTYLITSPLTEAELINFQLRNRSAAKPAHVLVFKREVSRFLPSPHDGRYDFLAAGPFSSWLTGGSLLYQILTS